MANLGRLFVAGIVAILLPAYLARHMQRDIFNTWTLVIQVGSFVGFLEIGIQTAVSKFVAEHHATGNLREASRILTNATVILTATGFVGLVAMCLISCFLKKILPGVSPNLLHPAQVGILLYGGSLAISLPASAFAGVFLGLQRNFPVMLLQSFGKFIFAFLVLFSVILHAPLVTITALAGAANIFTAVLQVSVTRREVPQIAFAISLLDRQVAATVIRYCSILSVWFVAQLLISGLDTTLVAHFEFAATASYAMAATLTSFINSLQTSMLSPLIPATSALSKHESPEYLGKILIRFTRYTSAIGVVTGIPFLLWAHRLLFLWVGKALADQGVRFLWVLSIAIVIRQFSLPYAVMLIGLGKQKLATISPIIEGIVNLTASILLARRCGAIGIAFGTLIGAFVGLAIHVCYSMRLTRTVLAVSQPTFVVQGILRPALLALPIFALAPQWLRQQALGWPTIAAAFCSTVALLYLVCLDSTDRHEMWRSLGVFADGILAKRFGIANGAPR